jgi:hypothetical protein
MARLTLCSASGSFAGPLRTMFYAASAEGTWHRDPLETPRSLASARLDMVPDTLDGSPSCQLIRVVRNTQLPARVRRALGLPR